MGNDISVGAVSNINVADISPHLAALVDAAGQTRPHGRVFTNLRCRYSRNINPENSSNSQNQGGVLDPIGVVDGEIRWEDGTPVSVKVFLRSYDDAQELKEITKSIERAIAVDRTIRAKLSMTSVAATGAFFFPVSLLHQDVFRVTDRAIWMARPWVQHSILQRFQMRPYVSTNRRLWFAFQLLRALSQLHDHCDLSHGDLKIENVLVDSHGWVYLTDLSNFYKPTFLPAFDPEVFEKRFNTGVRNSCCIAPERFYDKTDKKIGKAEGQTPRLQQSAAASPSANNSQPQSQQQQQQQQQQGAGFIDPFSVPPTKNSDIFSAACVMVTIMNDVSCFLTLSDVLALRKMLLVQNQDELSPSSSSSSSQPSSSSAAAAGVAALLSPAKSSVQHNNDNNNNNNNNNNDRCEKAEQFFRDKMSNATSGDRPLDPQVAEMITDLAFGFQENRIAGAENAVDRETNNNSEPSPGGRDDDKEKHSNGNSKGKTVTSNKHSSVMLMTQRPTALQVVEKYTPSVFPRSFNFLYNEVFPGLLCLTPDLQCSVLFKNLEAIVQKIVELDYGHHHHHHHQFRHHNHHENPSPTSSTCTSPHNNGDGSSNNYNVIIDTSFFSTEHDCSVTLERVAYAKQLSKQIRAKTPALAAAFECMSSIFVQLVRRCMLEQSLLMALSLIARAAPLFPDATLRDPLLPLIVTLLQSSVDTTDTVRTFALDALVFVCASVEAKLTPSNAFTFEDYVLPALCECGSSFARSPACMVTLARVLPITYLVCSEVAERREAMGPSFRSGYGYFGLRSSTIDKVWDTIKRLLNSSHTSVVVTALRSLPPLLPHLSADVVVGQVLPMLTLWFGANYVELRREMYRTMFEVIAHCSPQHQALATVGLDLAVGKEDDVLCIASVLEGLRGALLKKCFAKSRALEYVKKTAFLITHSSREVARAAASVIEAAVTTLDPVELAVFVLAPIAPFLRAPVPVSELVKKNYDIIRPMCRVPDPTTVSITEGVEYQNWCRDLAFFDLMTPTTGAMIISHQEVERAAQVMRDCGLDLDPFFCLRFAATVSTPSPLLSVARLTTTASTNSRNNDHNTKNNNSSTTGEEVITAGSLVVAASRRQQQQDESSSGGGGGDGDGDHHQQNQNQNSNTSCTITGPLVLFSDRRGKLTPKLLNRHANRLREIQISEISSQDNGSPWWSSGASSFTQHLRASAGAHQNPGAMASNANFATTRRNLLAASIAPGGAKSRLGPGSAAAVANFNTAGSGGGGGASTAGGGGGGGANANSALGNAGLHHQTIKPPKPTGVSVASHTEAHRGGVRCMVSQNQYLATGGGDGSIRVWDTEDAILGAGYLDGRCHKNIFATPASNNFGSPSSSLLNNTTNRNSSSFDLPTSPVIRSSSNGSGDFPSYSLQQATAPITALHFLGSSSGHTLVVGNEVGNACIYNVMAEAADIIPWATAASSASDDSTTNGNYNHSNNYCAAGRGSAGLGGVVSVSAPGNSEAIVFLGMAGGVVGAIDIRSPTSSAVWTAKTPSCAGPLVNFMFPSRDRFWSCVSVNRGGLVALWDLRMRAIVSSTDVIIPVTATSAASSSSPSSSSQQQQHQASRLVSIATATTTGLSSTMRARLYAGETNVTAACICEGFALSPNNNSQQSSNSNSFVPSVAVATDTSGIHRYDLASMKEVLSMRPTNEGSVRALASLGSTLYSGGTDSLLRNWDLAHPDRSFTISRGLEPSPPYSMITPTKVTEALPAAVDLITTGGGAGGAGGAGGGGWVDIEDNVGGGVNGGGSSSNEVFGVSGSPLHSDGITSIAIVCVTPSSAAVFGNKSFTRGQVYQSALEPDQLHVCTGSRDGSIALWRNSTSD